MSRLFDALRKGPSDEEVADYIFDVVQALGMIESIDYCSLLQQALAEGQSILTERETTEWLSYARYHQPAHTPCF